MSDKPKPTAGELAVGAMKRISRLKYAYEDLAEGAVRSEEHYMGEVSDEVRAEAVEMVKRGIRYMGELLAAKEASR